MRISKSPALTVTLAVLGLLSATSAVFAAGETAATAVAAVTSAAGTLPAPDMVLLAQKLGGLLVVATVMESALATIFTWRLYREFFNGRGMKTLVMIAFGWAVVVGFGYDIFQDVVRASGGSGDVKWLSVTLSSLVLAGGSAAINQLLCTLGLRAPVAGPEAAPKPPQNKAWVSVRVAQSPTRKTNDGVLVCIEEVADPAPTDPADPAKSADPAKPAKPATPELPTLAGVVRKKTFKDRLDAVFVADALRVPPWGGWTVNAGKVYRISVKLPKAPEEAEDAEEAKKAEKVQAKEVYHGRFAAGAIVDFVVTI